MSGIFQYPAASTGSNPTQTLPFDFQLFQPFFGTGANGTATISVDTDGGEYGSFGRKQYSTLTLNAGVKLQCPAGSTNGGLILAVSDTFNWNGAIEGIGGNATAAIIAGNSGSRGAGAGGPVVTAGQPTSYPGAGTAATANRSTGGAAGGVGPYAVSEDRVAPTNSTWFAMPASILEQFNVSGQPINLASLGSTINQNWNRFAIFGGRAGNASYALCSGGGGRAASGGGGGGGALLYIAAKHINFGGAASCTATGGNGGDGAVNIGTATGGGGDAGWGGRVIIICDTYSGTPVVPNVTGGLRGRDSVGGTLTPSSPAASGNNGDYLFYSVRGQV